MRDRVKDFYTIPSVLNELFDDRIELLPSVTELFELELAHLEYNLLDKAYDLVFTFSKDELERFDNLLTQTFHER